MAKQQLNQSQILGTTLGYAELSSNFATSTVGSYVDVTNLSVTVNVPTGGRDVKITLFSTSIYASTAVAMAFAIREGSTVLNQAYVNASGTASPYTVVARVPAPSAGTHTYKASVGINTAATITVQSTTPAFNAPGRTFLLVELA